MEEKLVLAERANEIYRQQLKYMQDHLQSMRSLIQDKESIIENLMLRFDLGTLPPESEKKKKAAEDKDKDKKPGDPDELRRKAEGLAQRTILENFELRVCLFPFFLHFHLSFFIKTTTIFDRNW